MSTDELKDEGAQSGYAEAAHWCPHVRANVAPIDLAEHEELDPNHTTCSRCPNQSENWFCLHEGCQQIFCGRFAQGHMLQHYESTGHCVAAGLGDLSFWCYKCESYLYHRTIPKLYASYAILTMLKFHEAPVDPPLDSAEPTATIAEGEVEEEEEKDQRMETSRTAAAAAAGAAAPSRSSSELEPYSPLEGDAASSAASSAAPSRAASSASAAAPSAGSASSLPSVAVPLEGLSPLQMAHPLVNKILGVLYGGALADAHGLATEFLDRAGVAQLYGAAYDPSTGAGAIPFPHTKKTRHSSRWDHGDWTDDTDQLILILETILESFAGASKFAVDSTPAPELFAAKLHQWVRRGFPELGDNGGMGLGALTAQVVGHKQFLTSPHKAAEAVWVAGGRKAAANGGVMRTAVTGVFDYMHPDRVVANTKAMCGVTHADPRCTASCVLIALLISRILQGAAIDTPAQTEALVDSCVTQTIAAVPSLAALGHEAAFREYIGLSRTLSELKLDDPPAIGYTLKCMGAGLFGLRSTESYATTITRLTREAGDADTNGAVCGAMLGARLGYDGLPAAWLQSLPNKRWMDKKVVALIKLMFERYEREAKAGGAATGAGAGAAAASSSSSAAAAAPSK